MAYKLIKANPEASEKASIPSTGLGASKYQGASGIGGYLGQQAAGAAARVAELPGQYKDVLESVANQPPLASNNPQESYENRTRREQVMKGYQKSYEEAQPLRDILPGSKDIRRTLEKTLGTQEGYLDPRGIIGDAAEMTVNALPWTLLLGSGALAPRIIKDFTSSLAMSTAKAAKLPAAAQIASGLLINPLLSAGKRGVQNLFRKSGTNKILNPTSLEAVGNEIANKYSNERDKLGKNISISANKYENALNNIGNKVSSNHFLDSTERKELLGTVEGLKNDAIGNKISASNIIKNKEGWNEVYPDLFKKSKSYQQYSRAIKEVLEDTRKEIGSHHPQWYEASKVVDDITKAKNLSFTATSLLNDYPQAKKILGNSLVQGLLFGSGTGAIVSGLAGAATGAAIGTAALTTSKLALNKAEKIWGFLKYPGARQVAQEVVKSIINEKTPELIRNLTKLNILAEQYEKKSVNKPISSEKTHYKLIKANHGL